MLIGTASVADLAVRASTIEHFTGETIRFDGVELLQLTAEMKNAARVAVLPPALHPTVPATLSVQVLNIRESPWGPFSFAVCRVGRRSGVRARGFTTLRMPHRLWLPMQWHRRSGIHAVWPKCRYDEATTGPMPVWNSTGH